MGDNQDHNSKVTVIEDETAASVSEGMSQFHPLSLDSINILVVHEDTANLESPTRSGRNIFFTNYMFHEIKKMDHEFLKWFHNTDIA